MSTSPVRKRRSRADRRNLVLLNAFQNLHTAEDMIRDALQEEDHVLVDVFTAGPVEHSSSTRYWDRWIADIDQFYLTGYKSFTLTGMAPASLFIYFGHHYKMQPNAATILHWNSMASSWSLWSTQLPDAAPLSSLSFETIPDFPSVFASGFPSALIVFFTYNPKHSLNDADVAQLWDHLVRETGRSDHILSSHRILIKPAEGRGDIHPSASLAIRTEFCRLMRDLPSVQTLLICSALPAPLNFFLGTALIPNQKQIHCFEKVAGTYQKAWSLPSMTSLSSSLSSMTISPIVPSPSSSPSPSPLIGSPPQTTFITSPPVSTTSFLADSSSPSSSSSSSSFSPFDIYLSGSLTWEQLTLILISNTQGRDSYRRKGGLSKDSLDKLELHRNRLRYSNGKLQVEEAVIQEDHNLKRALMRLKTGDPPITVTFVKSLVPLATLPDPSPLPGSPLTPAVQDVGLSPHSLDHPSEDPYCNSGEWFLHPQDPQDPQDPE